MDVSVNPRPRKLSEIRNDVRLLCHVTLPASDDLRGAASHLAEHLPAALRKDGLGPGHATELSEKLISLLRDLADAQDEATKKAHLVLDHLDQIRNTARVRKARDGFQLAVD